MEKLDICVCYTFILIFKFTLTYLLDVLFVLKIENIFEREKTSQKGIRGVVYFLYILV